MVTKSTTSARVAVISRARAAVMPWEDRVFTVSAGVTCKTTAPAMLNVVASPAVPRPSAAPDTPAAVGAIPRVDATMAGAIITK